MQQWHRLASEEKEIVAQRVKYVYEFSGSVMVEIEPNDYPHYFEKNAERGGLKALFKDIFYDEFDLRHAPFVEGTTEVDIIEYFEYKPTD